MIDTPCGYLTCGPLDARSRMPVLDRAQYLEVVAVDPHPLIDRGHLHVEDLDEDGNRPHQLKIWASVPRHMREPLPHRPA